MVANRVTDRETERKVSIRHTSSFARFLQNLFPCLRRPNTITESESETRSNETHFIQIQPGSLEEYYDLGKVISNSPLHNFRVCCLKSCRNPVFCYKTFYKHSDNAEARFRSELQIMQRLKNERGIVKVAAAYEDQDCFYLVMEYCEEGDLLNLVERKSKDGSGYSEDEAVSIFRQIVKSIKKCHKHGIMHGDIKLDNVFLSSLPPHPVVKLGNFGNSRAFRKGEVFDDCGTGTLPYMAPEVVERKGYDEAVDIWAAGVLLYKMLCGSYPFGGEREQYYSDTRTRFEIRVVKKNIVNKELDFSDGVSEFAKHLISGMLNRNPKERLTAMQILEHPWLNLK